MTGEKGKSVSLDVQALLSEDGDYLPRMVQALVEATLEAEMTAVLNAQKSECMDERLAVEEPALAPPQKTHRRAQPPCFCRKYWT